MLFPVFLLSSSINSIIPTALLEDRQLVAMIVLCVISIALALATIVWFCPRAYRRRQRLRFGYSVPNDPAGKAITAALFTATALVILLTLVCLYNF